MPRPRSVLLALLAGLALGAPIAASSDPRLLLLVALVEPVGTLWINGLRMVVVPLVFSLLFVGIVSVSDVRAVGRWGGGPCWCSCSSSPSRRRSRSCWCRPSIGWLVIDPATTAALRASAASTAEATSASLAGMPGLARWVVDLVPTNPVRAAADGAMLPLVVFTIAFGLAATR